MWIKFRNKIYNMDRISKIEASEQHNIMLDEIGKQNGFPFVHYANRRKAEWVLEMLCLAIKEGDNIFEFPEDADVDLDIAFRHTSHCTSRKVPHRGS